MCGFAQATVSDGLEEDCRATWRPGVGDGLWISRQRQDAANCFRRFLEAVKISRREPVADSSALLRHLATVRAIDLLRVRCRRRGRMDRGVNSDGASAVRRVPGRG